MDHQPFILDTNTKIITKERGTIRLGECTEQEHVLNNKGHFTPVQLTPIIHHMGGLHIEIKSGQNVTVAQDAKLEAIVQQEKQIIEASGLKHTQERELCQSDTRKRLALKQIDEQSLPAYVLAHLISQGRNDRCQMDYLRLSKEREAAFNRCITLLEEYLENNLKIQTVVNNKNYEYKRLKRHNKNTEQIEKDLQLLGLSHVPKERVFIPDAYRYGNHHERYAFIRGVVDSIGRERTHELYGEGYLIMHDSKWFLEQLCEMCQRTDCTVTHMRPNVHSKRMAIFIQNDACLKYDRSNEHMAVQIREKKEKRHVIKAKNCIMDGIGIICKEGRIALANGLTL